MTGEPRRAEVILEEDRWGRSWVIECCPYCGKRHSHGAGGLDDDPDEFLGHRVAHCINSPSESDPGYMLVRKQI